jgi:epsilon-lactone hydrolase
MKRRQLLAASAAGSLTTVLTLPALATADQTSFPPLDVPARRIPVPTTVSPEMQKIIAKPIDLKFFMEPPTTADAWKAMRNGIAAATIKNLPELRQVLGVSVENKRIGSVNCYILTPDTIPEANRHRLLMHLHAGGHVLFPGESGTREAIMMAGLGHFRVISVDYRLVPDFPFPADLDDAVAVWKEVAKMEHPANTAIFGTSAGGTLTLAVILQAKREGLPLPAAIAPGSPNADLTWTGDTLFTNELIDNVFSTFKGFAEAGNKLYSNGHDLKDPLISPIYGDFHGFPPAILTSGTRDLLLSDTVRVHRKLRQAGVEAYLQVFEGMSHGQYLSAPSTPEVKEAFAEIVAFLDSHLGK